MSLDTTSMLKLKAALKGRRTRSELYSWLWEHYGWISAIRKPGVRTDWTGFADELSKLGIKATNKGLSGKKLRGETVRRTFARVDKDAKAVGWTGTTADIAPEPAKQPLTPVRTMPDPLRSAPVIAPAPIEPPASVLATLDALRQRMKKG